MGEGGGEHFPFRAERLSSGVPGIPIIFFYFRVPQLPLDLTGLFSPDLLKGSIPDTWLLKITKTVTAVLVDTHPSMSREKKALSTRPESNHG